MMASPQPQDRLYHTMNEETPKGRRHPSAAGSLSRCAFALSSILAPHSLLSLLIPIHVLRRKGRHADRDVLRPIRFRRAVADPFTAMGDHRLAGTHIQCASLVVH